VDCINWAQLPDVHPVIVASCSKIRSLFSGNPSHEYTVKEPGASMDEERPELPADVESIRSEETKGDGSIVVTTVISEEKRLSATVQAIDFETRTVPRGVFKKTAGDIIEKSHTFSGLSAQQAAKLESYLHRRQPLTLLKKSPTELAKLDSSLDIMDTLKDDIPKHCWSIQFQQGSKAVVLRSFLWPGFVFYHAPGTPFYGHIYQGDGQRNNDLIFEL
jgi:radial spoke head protein 9